MSNESAEVRVAQINAVAQIVSAAISKGIVGRIEIPTLVENIARRIKSEL